LNARSEELREITCKLGFEPRFASEVSFGDELPKLRFNGDEVRQFFEELFRLEVVESSEMEIS
jgi:hypothetical protein